MSSSNSLEDMKTMLFDMRDDIAELRMKQQALLDQQSVLMEKIDQLINTNTSTSRIPPSLPDGPPPPRDIPTPKNTDGTFRRVSAASILGVIQNHWFTNGAEAKSKYNLVSRLARMEVSTIQTIIGTPGRCQSKWSDINSDLRQDAFQRLELECGRHGVILARCINSWAAKYLIASKWESSSGYFRGSDARRHQSADDNQRNENNDAPSYISPEAPSHPAQPSPSPIATLPPVQTTQAQSYQVERSATTRKRRAPPPPRRNPQRTRR